MKQILVVDDNLANLQQISAQLEESYDVSLAKSGHQALLICLQSEPDLILLDLDMPVMDGFETLAAIKKNLSLRHIPVIILTSTSDPIIEVKALKSGAVDFIAKPADRDILHHRIEVHLRLSTYNRELENTVRILEDSIISSFSDMIEYRDENTGGHVARTARYVGILANQLLEMGRYPGEVNERSADMMSRAAPLHDVGKIGISDIILLKPSLLNDEEFSIMKTHTTIGADILKGIFARVPPQDYHDYAITIAESHHERWDGRGYPKGLKGLDIPLCARIMSVADVFDALIDVRVYKRPMSHSDACRIIISEKGNMFDPDVVEAFQAVEEQLAQVAGRRL
ncbi:MAG: response regulator [Deltaproteobacteria bacterium]|jgi:putative two-component system response regulator|nr:response regulator [Deltaproteobacteria bacterium]